MKVRDFIEKMNEFCPFDSAYSWDNVGLLVGDCDSDIKGIYIALDVSDEVIEHALEKNCNLILTHHPMIFKPVPRVVNSDMNGRRIISMIKNNMSYVAMHTNFDVYIMWKIVAEKLGFSDYKVLDITGEDGEEPIGIGSISLLKNPLSIEELAILIKEKMGLPFVTYYGDKKKVVSTVAVVPGSGKSEINTAILMGAEVLITGDITHHEGIDAEGSGLSIIDAGHDGLERIFINYMRDYLFSCFTDIIIETEPLDLKRRMV